MRERSWTTLARGDAGAQRAGVGLLAGVALAGVALAGSLLAALPSQAAPAPATGGGIDREPLAVESGGAVGGTGATGSTVTLVTGDTVHVTDLDQNRFALRVDAADGAAGVAYSSWTDAAGDLHVVPAQALRLVPDRLDPRLFNISALVRDSYDDASRPELPILLEFSGAPVAIAGTTPGRELPSVGAVAATIDKSGAARLGAALARSAPNFLAGVDKIWLDGPVHASLDESVPQVGAPEVWADGFDGTGVTIAVLDTGIDDTHPDLAGRVVAAENFSDSAVVTDLHGHGTHVASIAAGNGAVSGGQLSGVAYGADLASGKVLDDTGQGTESSVIAGMEWAATEVGAKIINVSVNSGPSDGTDLVSQAVNALSASHRSLFVVSAGDGGYGYAETVSAPATADAALAVGAVDKSDVLADFTGLGPRIGSFAIKPEIVAPGVAITAARADGSSIGNPVDDDYTELTGTSMAAPHVSGAAALLLQAHPQLPYEALKAALVTSADRLGNTVYEEGGGRLDVAAAVAQPLRTVTSTVDLGVFAYPHDDGETASVEIVLVNTTDADLTVDLAAAAENEDGEAAPAAMLLVEPATTTLAAGEAAAVTVTADPESGPTGLFSGSLRASSDGAELLHVPLGLDKEDESYTLTVEALDRQGGDDLDGQVLVTEVETGEVTEAISVFPGSTTVELRVPVGTYAAVFQSFQFRGSVTELVDVSAPEFLVDEDTTVVLDGRDALPVTYDVGEPTNDLSVNLNSYRGTVTGAGGFVASLGASYFESMPAFAAPTDPITTGAYEYFTQWTSDGAEIHYDLLVPEPDAIPAGLAYEIGPDDVAQIELDFHAEEGGRDYATGRIGFRPYGGIGGSGSYLAPAPGERTDWVSGGDILWFGFVDASQSPPFVELQELQTTYENGSRLEQRWYASPVRPGFVPALYPPTRYEDTLSLTAFSFVDADGHFGFADPGYEEPSIDDVSYTLRADGEVVSAGDELRFLNLDVAPEATAYELRLDTARDAVWWLSSIATSTTWRFSSATSTDPDGTPLPLLEVGYGIDVGLRNAAISPTPVRFDVGGSGAEIAALDAWWSIDDGATWSDLEVEDLGGGSYEGEVAVPDTSAVSLRVAAEDADGNAIEQEVIRAYTGVFSEPTPTPTETSPSPSPTPTDPTPTGTGSPTVGPTTTLPGTGGGNAGWLAGIGIGVIVLGALVVVLARRRLTPPE